MSMFAPTRRRIAACAGLALALWLPRALAGAQTAPSSAAGCDDGSDGHGRLYLAGDEPFPETTLDISAWLAQRQPASQVSLFGGSYWFYVEIRHATPVTEWVLDPSNTLIDQVEIRAYGPDGDVQPSFTGYRHDHQYMLHYGKDVRLWPETSYHLLIRFASPYFASHPRIEIVPELDDRHKVCGRERAEPGRDRCVARAGDFQLPRLRLYPRQESHLLLVVHARLLHGLGLRVQYSGRDLRAAQPAPALRALLPAAGSTSSSSSSRCISSR